jgi:monoamine oxidase
VVNKVRGKDLSFNQCLARHAPRLGAEAKTWARAFVEGFDAADADQVSCQWLADAQKDSEEIDGDRIARIYDGYERIINFLRTGIQEPDQRIRLSTIVTDIRWQGPSVEVEARNAGGERVLLHGRCVLITVPVGVLQLAPGKTGHIAFDPPLPAQKQQAIGLLRSGPVVKVILRCHDAFWEKSHPDLNFFHASGKDMAFPTWWTTLPIRTSILTGWSGGPAAALLSGKSPAEILFQARKTLSRLLAVSPAKLQKQISAAHVCDWQSEPLSRGAYSYAAVNGASAARDLAKPLQRRLFFAGEASHTGLTGTVAAALASAYRAAKQILHAV